MPVPIKIVSVAGARPNFMKIAPLHREFAKRGSAVAHKVCHTGQHFDDNMSRVFFEELEIPAPDFNLGVGSGSHAVQTARIMEGFEAVLAQERPDLVVVVGDVNSTIACSLVAAKMNIPVAHVEAGLRSHDRTMPEEINRKLTDHLSDFLFITEESGMENLRREGILREGTPRPVIAFVGNVMIDSLVYAMPRIESSGILDALDLRTESYVVMTFHRPSNVDDPANLARLVRFLNRVADSHPVVFPVHPRTRRNIGKAGLETRLHPKVKYVDPMGYFDFIALVKNAVAVVTDSGGIQEETTYLGIQCVTARDNTERPVTVTVGTNHLAGSDLAVVESTLISILSGQAKRGSVPKFWDGFAARRIVDILISGTEASRG
ncbi:MAG: non-hydrolyzing UDP-N-acetylglucosamine 2-epimerase [Candidatus Aminicenantales bacterium]